MALVPSSKICGAAVSARDGTALGSITDFMVDHATGHLTYAVLSHGGVLGVGEKLFAVPWSAFTVDPVAHTLSLDTTAERLSAAKGISKDAWPADAADWRA